MSIGAFLFLALPAAAQDSAIPVRIVEVLADGGAPDSIRATGTLEPAHELHVAFAVGGVVTALLAEDGDSVDAGEALARLDAVPFEAAVTRAESQVRFLENRVARSEELLAARAISAEEFESDRSQLESARAELRLAAWNLERSILRAPFAGRVVRTHIEVGQVISAGTAAVHLLDATVLELRASLPASAAPRIDRGAAVPVQVVASPGMRATGRVHHLPFRSDERSGAVPVLVTVENRDGALIPGLVAECEVPLTGQAQTRIPLSALRVEPTGHAVWKVEADRARHVPVRLGEIRGDTVRILEGIEPGDRIVDRAPDRLRDGDRVEQVPATGGAR